MDNIKQVVKDIRFLIATNCCDETIQARIKNFINENEQALRQPTVISSVCTCSNSELEKGGLVPVFCHTCNAYVQTDL